MRVGPFGHRPGDNEFRRTPEEFVPKQGRKARSVARSVGKEFDYLGVHRRRHAAGRWWWFGWPGAVVAVVVGATVGALLLGVGLLGLRAR